MNTYPQDWAPLAQKQPKQSIRQIAGRLDATIAILAFVLGYMFIRLMFNAWTGYGVTIFTAAYLALSSFYFRGNEKRRNTDCTDAEERAAFSFDSKLAFAVTALTSISYALYDATEFAFWRGTFLMLSAVIWTVSAGGFPIGEKTGAFLPFDVLNALFVTAIANIGAIFPSLGGLRKPNSDSADKRNRRSPGILAGIFITILLFLCVIPLLLQADSGGFQKLTGSLFSAFTDFIAQIVTAEFAADILLTIPVAMFIFGLFFGAAHKRHTKHMTAEGLASARETCRFVPKITSEIVTVSLSSLYAVYIACQLPYFFSAFGGGMPEGWISVTEFARQGFFELCGVASITLVEMLLLSGLCAVPFRESGILKLFNTVLSALTLTLSASAFSKLALYVAVDGVSMKRALPCVFLFFVCIVFVMVILFQRREFNIARMAIAAGASIMVIMSLINADALVIRSNVSRYLNGKINLCDISLFYRSGPSGVESALRVLDSGTISGERAAEIENYLSYVYRDLSSHKTGTSASAESSRAEERLAGREWREAPEASAR